jgi:hypothetical protein
MAEKRDPTIVAIEDIYAALKDLDSVTRKRVLSSAFALLGESTPASNPAAVIVNPATQSPISVRPIGLVELINEKRPGTNAQRIAVVAYYRERTEGNPRFSRADLEAYFAKARLAPAANYSRDFNEAVRAGWIHEDGAESYLTTKGIEAIEAGFEGERKYSMGKKSKKKKVVKKGQKSARKKKK